jgi:hypothetical protein
LKLAAVQLSVVPFGVGPNGSGWIPNEPGIWPIGRDTDVLPLRALNELPSIRQLRLSNEKRLVDLVHVRLQQVLSFLDESGVDLCVFPEYSLPCDEETLKLLAGFSQRMVIVAGLGTPRPQGVSFLESFVDEPVRPTNNVVAVFGPESRHIVTKLNPAAGEQIEPGTGPRLLTLPTPLGPLKLGVAVCKDYVVDGQSGASFGAKPDVVAIPALTSASDPFHPGDARDFPRVFANGAAAGRSNVFASGVSGPFVEKQLPLALPAGSEGIIAVDWNGAIERPTGVLKEDNSVFLRASLIARADGGPARDIIANMRSLAESSYATGMIEAVPRWLRFLHDKPALAILRDAVEEFYLAASDDILNERLVDLLGSHVVSVDTISPIDLKYQLLAKAASELERLAAANLPDNQYRSALQGAQSYADWRPGSGQSQTFAETGQTSVIHFEIGLGIFDRDEAVATIPEQEDFLAAFFRGAPSGSRVCFILRTKEDPGTGAIGSRFVMRFIGPNTDDARDYFASLAPICRSVFIRGWSVYTPDDLAIEGVCVEILGNPGSDTAVVREDLGLLVDAVAASSGRIALEMIAFADDPVEKVESVRFGVRLYTSKVNRPLADLVGSTLFPEGWSQREVDPALPPSTQATSLKSALTVLHPPDGRIDNRGAPRHRPLEIAATSDVEFSGEGAFLGSATVQGPAADKTIDVRIPDESRTVHSYILGRTGSGKTNTLKNVVRHDLGLESSVIVIDPHGELFAYALLHAVGRREFVALDFSGDRIPSVNPIYLDATDEAGVLRNIDELVEMMVRTTYHENAGPRFRDIARLCLETLVAVADERTGIYASLTDLPQLIEDLAWRNQQISRLRRLGRSDLVRRWEAHGRMKEGEQAEVEQWFVSKFSDFRRSAKFAAAVSGKPDVSLINTLRDHSALFIKVPTIGLGLGASRFLGSLIVERVLRYTMERGFNESSDPASLVVDEFQTFVGTSFLQLIPEARKFNLAVTVANQTLSQLTTFNLYEGSRSAEMERAILGNAGNLIVHSVGHSDADRLAQEFAVPVRDVMRIGRHTALVALTIRGIRSSAFTVELADADQRPGVVSESSLESQVLASIERASGAVTMPKIGRSELTLPGFETREARVTEPEAHPITATSEDFLTGWQAIAAQIQKRQDSGTEFEPSEEDTNAEDNEDE